MLNRALPGKTGQPLAARDNLDPSSPVLTLKLPPKRCGGIGDGPAPADRGADRSIVPAGGSDLPSVIRALDAVGARIVDVTTQPLTTSSWL
jgi:hypothetical protein